MKQGVLFLGIKNIFTGNHLVNEDPVHRPAVRIGNRAQFHFCFGQGYIHYRFALSCSFEQKLKSHRRLARSWFAFDQIKPIAREPAAKYGIQAGYTCRQEGRSRTVLFGWHGMLNLYLWLELLR
jgi:hypothetical protein